VSERVVRAVNWFGKVLKLDLLSGHVS